MIVKIFGRHVPVIIKENLLEETGNLGEYDYDHETITVDASLKGLELDRTIFHEILHAMFDRVNLTAYFGPDEKGDIEELIISNLEDFMFETYHVRLKPSACLD